MTMQTAAKDTENYESLTDPAIPSPDDKSYTELSSDAWNEIFPLRKPLVPQLIPVVVVDNIKTSQNISTGIQNCNLETTPIHQNNNKVIEDEMGYVEPNDTPYYLRIAPYANNQENTEKSLADDAIVCSNSDSLDQQKPSCAIYVSQESDCAHEYDYIQNGGIIYPSKLNAKKSSSGVTSSRPLPVLSEATYEPLKRSTQIISYTTKCSRRKCLRIGVSLLIFVVLASAVIIGIFFGLSNRGKDNLLVIDAVQGDGRISGITILDSQMFVVRYKLSPAVYVYNTSDFSFTRYITINGSSSLRAIVGSPKENCLYISDTDLNVVYRYNLSNNVVTQWRVSGRCYGLSLTITGNILVALRNTTRMQEYTPLGILVREIPLGVIIDIPWQSVQLASGNFAISSGIGGSINRVCTVNSSGSSMLCYGSTQGSGDGQLNKPGQLAVAIEDNVYVADTGNDRIVFLNSSLTLLSYYTIPEYQLSSPWALYLDQINRRLYIGEWTSAGRLFSISV